MAFCSNCGAEIPEGAGFCGNCGAPVAAPKQETVQEEIAAAPEAEVQPELAPQVQAYRAPRAARNAAPAPKNKKALMIASIVFAVGFLFFFIGLGGRIYTGRVVSSFTKEYNEQYDKELEDSRTRYGVDSDQYASDSKRYENLKIKGSKRGLLIDGIAAAAHGDAKGMYATFLKAYRIGHPDYKDDATYQSLVRTPLTSKQVDSLKVSIREDTKDAHEKYGFNWTMLTLGSHYSFFMWFGGILAVGALCVWILMGGRTNNFMQTTCWPALAAAFVLALTFMILDLALDSDMNVLVARLWNGYKYYF